MTIKHCMRYNSNKLRYENLIPTQNKSKWEEFRHGIYQGLVGEIPNLMSVRLKERLRRRMQELRTQLISNRIRNPQNYYKILKAVLRMNKRKGETSEPKRIIYTEEGEPIRHIGE